MDFLGIPSEQLTQYIILAVVLTLLWFAARVALKLTVTLFRAGCLVIFLVIAALFLVGAIG
jgi:hypothetical protein